MLTNSKTAALRSCSARPLRPWPPPSIRFSINGRRRPALAQAMAATLCNQVEPGALSPEPARRLFQDPDFIAPKPPVATAPWDRRWNRPLFGRRP